MNGGVTTCAPTRTATQEGRVRNIANKNISAHRVHLRVTFETKIIVALDEHFVRDGPVRLMTNSAAFTQRFVFVDDQARLFAMALCARFIQAREPGCSPSLKSGAMRCLENVCSVRIVALDAIHSIFQHRMMVRQSELGVHMDMTSETGLRFPAGIDNKFAAPAPGLHVQAAWSVARFATGRLASRRTFEMQARMRARWKDASDVRMAIDAGLVPNKSRSLDHRRRHHGTSKVGTGSQNNADQPHASCNDGEQNSTNLHAIIPIFFTGRPAGKPCLETGVA